VDTLSNNSVTTSNITDGTIVNADISGSAAIVGSKLDLSTPGAIGGTTPSTGTFSTLTATTINAFTLGGKITGGSSEIEGSNFDIDGGTIDGATIGGASAGVGTFTSITTPSLTATGNLDIGSYSFTAQTLVSDIAIGTAPFTVTSTTKVTNLNADQLDGQDDSYYTNMSNAASGTLAVARGGTGITGKILNIVTYTGNNSNQTVAHGLGTTPAIIIICETGDNNSNPYLWMTGYPTNKMRSIDAAGSIVSSVFTAAPDATNVYLTGGKTDVNENGLGYMMISIRSQ
jgi:hypothetical protein